MDDFFRQDQADWYSDYVAQEVYEMRREFDEHQALEDIKEFDLDVPF